MDGPSIENGVYFILLTATALNIGVQFSGGSFVVIIANGAIQEDYLDSGDGIVYGEVDLNRSRTKSWENRQEEIVGDRLANHKPGAYMTLVNNTYLWEPLHYHGLYEEWGSCLLNNFRVLASCKLICRHSLGGVNMNLNVCKVSSSQFSHNIARYT